MTEKPMYMSAGEVVWESGYDECDVVEDDD